MSEPQSSRRSQGQGGPSPGTVAWRRFVLETLLCVVLLTLIVLIGVRVPTKPLAGLAVAALVTWIVRILWRRW
jgi:hypothetical protein